MTQSRYARGRTGVWFIVVAALIALIVCIGPVCLYRAATGMPTAYETSQILVTSLGAGVTCFAALCALGQYWRNSRDNRVERSMSFWERSNSRDFTTNLRDFLEYWARLDTNEGELPDFRGLAAADAEHQVDKISIEHILDFYDEACAAVMMGASDEEALRFYLGSLMRKHAATLAGFIEVWRTKHSRPERWDCYTAMIGRWEDDPRDWDEMVGKQPDLGQLERSRTPAARSTEPSQVNGDA